MYRSPYSQVQLNESRQILVAKWLEPCKQLSPPEVRNELVQMLEYIKTTQVENVIVDATCYYFQENPDLQKWINYTFMPAVCNLPVKRYAIVVNKLVPSVLSYWDEHDFEVPHVEYFTDFSEAWKWIEQKVKR
jgi:hypothetical protein